MKIHILFITLLLVCLNGAFIELVRGDNILWGDYIGGLGCDKNTCCCIDSLSVTNNTNVYTFAGRISGLCNTKKLIFTAQTVGTSNSLDININNVPYNLQYVSSVDSIVVNNNSLCFSIMTKITPPDQNGIFYDPSIWLGKYKVMGCNETICCCPIESNIIDNNNGQYSINNIATGVCNGIYTQTLTINKPQSNYLVFSSVATLSYDPDSQTITGTNLIVPQCSNIGTKMINSSFKINYNVGIIFMLFILQLLFSFSSF
jgi:hypothetical protein